LISEYLAPLGFKVMVARNEYQCLEMINKKLPDIVLIDTHLPSSGGIHTMRKIRGKGVNVPVLLLSSNYGISSHNEAVELGANGFIEKPFRMKDFLDQVLNALPN
jgi:two-component system KDP operon response regulator KdpE